jgi:hypothetical protein
VLHAALVLEDEDPIPLEVLEQPRQLGVVEAAQKRLAQQLRKWAEPLEVAPNRRPEALDRIA